MKTDYRQEAHRGALRNLFMTALLGLVMLVSSGCEEPGAGDGTVVNQLMLPTDVVLNLFCEDVGINDEQCVLDDPENPFAFTSILEPDQIDEDDANPPPDKFALNDSLPQGPTGAKARFYLWATALARRQTGENQWYTARALHELYDANSNRIFEDIIVKAQAKKAYRSVLDNFWGQVTFFVFGGEAFPAPLNEQVARDIFYRDPPLGTGFRQLVDSQLAALALFGEWGYTYDPEIDVLFRNE